MMQILTPIAKQVFQRDNKGNASLKISGTTTTSETVRITVNEVGKIVNIVDTNAQSTVTGWELNVALSSGFYELTAKDSTDSKTLRFGVGEVIICTGHSFAEGIGSAYVTDERAIIQSNIDGAEVNPADFTATPVYKSIKDYALTDNTYSKTRGIWGQMAENLVKAFNCPVLIYQTSWGGTSLKQWAIASNGGLATGYAGYNSANDGKGYPYAKLKNIVQKLVPQTGARAVLILHGNNDTSDTQSNIEQYYRDIIANTRKDANLPTLPFLVALSTWHPDTETQVTNAQLNVIAQVSNVYKGADINTIPNSGRINPSGNPIDEDLHLNQAGDTKAAALWADSITKLVNAKLSITKIEPIVVIGGTGTVVTNPTDKATKPVLYGLGIFVFLLLLRAVGIKLPFGLVAGLGVSAGLAVFVTDDFPTKI